MNKISIIGRLCADPELKTISSGAEICTFSVAVSRRFKKDETDFFNIVTWKTMATNCHKYLHKGSQIAVIGALQIKQYEFEGMKRQSVEIQADEIEFLGGKIDETVQKQNKLQDLEEVDFGSMPF